MENLEFVVNWKRLLFEESSRFFPQHFRGFQTQSVLIKCCSLLSAITWWLSPQPQVWIYALFFLNHSVNIAWVSLWGKLATALPSGWKVFSAFSSSFCFQRTRTAKNVENVYNKLQRLVFIEILNVHTCYWCWKFWI